MPDMKGAEIIVDHLIEENVPYLFGLCGHGIVGLMDAARDRSNRIKTVSVHNEQIAGFAADAYYRVSRQPTATFTSCGPGSVNIQMAIANALFDSSAVFAITGNIPTQQFNMGPFQEFGHHHQADYVSAMRPYVKRSYQATRADMLPSMMRHAYTMMLAGRPGPVCRSTCSSKPRKRRWLSQAPFVAVSTFGWLLPPRYLNQRSTCCCRRSDRSFWPATAA
jgi:acetolactate synthase-1/2/3 large subunit